VKGSYYFYISRGITLCDQMRMSPVAVILDGGDEGTFGVNRLTLPQKSYSTKSQDAMSYMSSNSNSDDGSNKSDDIWSLKSESTEKAHNSNDKHKINTINEDDNGSVEMSIQTKSVDEIVNRDVRVVTPEKETEGIEIDDEPINHKKASVDELDDPAFDNESGSIEKDTDAESRSVLPTFQNLNAKTLSTKYNSTNVDPCDARDEEDGPMDEVASLRSTVRSTKPLKASSSSPVECPPSTTSLQSTISRTTPSDDVESQTSHGLTRPKSVVNEKARCEFHNIESDLDEGDLPSLEIPAKREPTTLNPSRIDSMKGLYETNDMAENHRSRSISPARSANSNGSAARRLSPRSRMRHRAFWGQLEEDLPDDEMYTDRVHSLRSGSHSPVKKDWAGGGGLETRRYSHDIVDDDDEDAGILGVMVDMCSDSCWGGEKKQLSKKKSGGSSVRKNELRNVESMHTFSEDEQSVETYDSDYTNEESSLNDERKMRMHRIRTSLGRNMYQNTADQELAENTAIEVEYIPNTYNDDDSESQTDNEDDYDLSTIAEGTEDGSTSVSRSSKPTESFLQLGAGGAIAVHLRENEDSNLSKQGKGGSLTAHSRTWSSSDKNDYLRKLAQKAKKDYQKKKGSKKSDSMSVVSEDNPSNFDSHTKISNSDKEDDQSVDSVDEILGKKASSHKKNSNFDWSSPEYEGWTNGEKRRFIQLINGNASLKEALFVIQASRKDVNPGNMNQMELKNDRAISPEHDADSNSEVETNPEDSKSSSNISNQSTSSPRNRDNYSFNTIASDVDNTGISQSNEIVNMKRSKSSSNINDSKIDNEDDYSFVSDIITGSPAQFKLGKHSKAPKAKSDFIPSNSSGAKLASNILSNLRKKQEKNPRRSSLSSNSNYDEDEEMIQRQSLVLNASSYQIDMHEHSDEEKKVESSMKLSIKRKRDKRTKKEYGQMVGDSFDSVDDDSHENNNPLSTSTKSAEDERHVLQESNDQIPNNDVFDFDEERRVSIDRLNVNSVQVKGYDDINTSQIKRDLPKAITSSELDPYKDSSDVSVLTGFTSGNDGTASVYTSGTNASSWSISTRRRHRGAAKNRRKEIVDTNGEISGDHKAAGWLESIQAAAAKNRKEWNPEQGWVGYVDPDVDSGAVAEKAHIGELHLTKHLNKKEELKFKQEQEIREKNPSDLPFPKTWERERSQMIGDYKDDESAFSAVTEVVGNGLQKRIWDHVIPHESNGGSQEDKEEWDAGASDVTELHTNLKRSLDVELDKIESMHDEEQVVPKPQVKSKLSSMAEEAQEKIVPDEKEDNAQDDDEHDFDQFFHERVGQEQDIVSEDECELSTVDEEEECEEISDVEEEYYIDGDKSNFSALQYDSEYNPKEENICPPDQDYQDGDHIPKLKDCSSITRNLSDKDNKSTDEMSVDDHSSMMTTPSITSVRPSQLDFENSDGNTLHVTAPRLKVPDDNDVPLPSSEDQKEPELEKASEDDVIQEDEEEFPVLSFGSSFEFHKNENEVSNMNSSFDEHGFKVITKSGKVVEPSTNPKASTENEDIDDIVSQHVSPPPPPLPKRTKSISKAKDWVSRVESKESARSVSKSLSFARNEEIREVGSVSLNENNESPKPKQKSLSQPPDRIVPNQQPIFISAIDDDSAFQLDVPNPSADDDSVFEFDKDNGEKKESKYGEKFQNTNGLKKKDGYQRHRDQFTNVAPQFSLDAKVQGLRNSESMDITQSFSTEQKYEEDSFSVDSSAIGSSTNKGTFFSRLNCGAGSMMYNNNKANQIRNKNKDIPHEHLAFLLRDTKRHEDSSQLKNKPSIFNQIPATFCGKADTIHESFEEHKHETKSAVANRYANSDRMLPDRTNAKERYLKALKAGTQSNADTELNSMMNKKSSTEPKQSEAWQRFLKNRSTSSILSDQNSNASTNVSRDAQKYAAAKVDEIMSDFKKPDDQKNNVTEWPGRQIPFHTRERVDNMIDKLSNVENHNNNLISPSGNIKSRMIPNSRLKSDQNLNYAQVDDFAMRKNAAEELAAARVEAMMAAMSTSKLNRRN